MRLAVNPTPYLTVVQTLPGTRWLLSFYEDDMLPFLLRALVILYVADVLNDKVVWREGVFFLHFKGTVQRKLTGIESDINQKVFLSH
jgi:hypothetical protein